ncbi:DUF4834 family protein [uncultured Lacinutrix sp.]|uniref:DUF4834 family protein n=1 Tax=uncultured Lacinutrix sp. TaxID=574032 RepID=UPI00260FDE98|nr:DUF4834 family protein [uncultured Lacinutrix sp.]
MGLIKTILIILLFYYGFKILSRFFGPFILKYFTKKATERFGGQFRDFNNQKQQQPQQKEGEITIDKMPNNKSSNKTVGEYVDYEEID